MGELETEEGEGLVKMQAEWTNKRRRRERDWSRWRLRRERDENPF